jgi:hypothetical protein
VTLVHLPLGKSYLIFNIYMPSIYQDKVHCWKSLVALRDQVSSSPYIFVGDFNTTLHVLEKREGNVVRDSTKEFMEVLLVDLNLVDIKPSIGRFTWSNKRHDSGHIAARLDRFPIGGSIFEDQILPLSCILPKEGSDHHPISLALSSPIIIGPIPFRFNPSGF